jgi:hypothetical protein
MGLEEPVIKGTIQSNYNFWCTLTYILWFRELKHENSVEAKSSVSYCIMPINKSAVGARYDAVSNSYTNGIRQIWIYRQSPGSTFCFMLL